jgi:hypothetical protein
MYELHEVKFNIELDIINKELKLLERNKKKLLSYFKLISLPDNVNFENIELGKEKVIDNPTSSYEIFYNAKLKDYNSSCIIYNNKIEVKNLILQHKIKPVIFNYILNRFNELLSEEIIYYKYKFKDLFLGGLLLISNKSPRPSINWKISLDNKKKLIEEGKIPYLKNDAEVAKQNNQEYNGIKWLHEFTGFSLFFQWELENKQFIRLPNIKNFTFEPYRGSNSPVSKLTEYKNTLTEAQLTNFNTEHYAT